MKTEQKRIKIEGKLLAVYVFLEVTDTNGGLGDASQAVDPGLLLPQQNRSDLSWPIAEFGACGNENATAFHVCSPSNPVVDKCFDAGNSSWYFQGWDNHMVRKFLGCMIEDFNLHVLFGLKMGKETAF